MRTIGSTCVALLFALSVLGLTSVASAQTAGAAQSGGSQGQNKKYKETTKYDFQADSVTGELVKPQGAGVQGNVHGKTSSLINIRSDFISQMIKSVEDL